MLLDDKMIFAIDFDGTLASTDYPTIIEPNKRLINFLKIARETGNIIILNTCRHDVYLTEAVSFCEQYGLTFDYVNENVPELIKKYGDCRKISADVYVDDKALDVSALLNYVDIFNKKRSEEKA